MGISLDDAIHQFGEEIVRILWGEPNAAMSKKGNLRWGSKGARSYQIKEAAWADFEDGEESGGILKLIKKERGLEGAAAVRWMEQALKIKIGDDRDDRRRGNGHATSEDYGLPEQTGYDAAPWDEGEPVSPPPPPPPPAPPKPKNTNPWRVAKVYDYVDEAGKLILQTVRKERKSLDEGGKPDKTFMQRRPPREGDDPKFIRDGWYWKIDGARLVPYCLPEVVAAVKAGIEIFIVEGEKNVDHLRSWGLTATTNPMGAKKWPESFRDYFTDALVTIIPDNDQPGRDHAKMVAKNLTGIARDVRLLNLPDVKEKGDIIDWAEAGNTPDAFDKLVETAEHYDPTLEDLPPSKFDAIWFEQIDRAPIQRHWSIKGLVQQRGLSVWYGAPGCGKSFLAVDMTLTMALATYEQQQAEWFGYRVLPGTGVVYIGAEGQDDLRIRMQAWRRQRGVASGIRLPFVLFPVAVDLLAEGKDSDTVKLVREINIIRQRMMEQRGVNRFITIVDTLQRSMAGGNENAPEVMGATLKHCEAIEKYCESHVGLIHHTNANGDLRGHSSLRGSADLMVEVKKPLDEDKQPMGPKFWRVEKNKPGREGAKHHFRLDVIELARDEDGDVIDSMTVSHITGEPEGDETGPGAVQPAKKKAGPNLKPAHKVAMQALEDALADYGMEAPIRLNLPPYTRVVDMKHFRNNWLRKTYETPEEQNSNAATKQFGRIKQQLAADRLISLDGEIVWALRSTSTFL